MKIIIAVPAYNESENITELLAQLEQKIFISKIYVVDDSPNDLTSVLFRHNLFPKTSYIKRNSKLGRGSAVLNVMQRITTDDFKYLIEMDADFSHQPNEIANLIAIAETESANLVIASRYIDGSSIINWPLSRRIFSRLANKLAKIILKAPVNDYTNGFRIYTKDAVELIVNKCGNIGGGFILLSEIIMVLNNSGFKIVETNTTFVNRIRGESSLTISEIRKSLVGLYKLKK